MSGSQVADGYAGYGDVELPDLNLGQRENDKRSKLFQNRVDESQKNARKACGNQWKSLTRRQVVCPNDRGLNSRALRVRMKTHRLVLCRKRPKANAQLVPQSSRRSCRSQSWMMYKSPSPTNLPRPRPTKGNNHRQSNPLPHILVPSALVW
jgi:hypothetical protein